MAARSSSLTVPAASFTSNQRRCRCSCSGRVSAGNSTSSTKTSTVHVPPHFWYWSTPPSRPTRRVRGRLQRCPWERPSVCRCATSPGAHPPRRLGAGWGSQPTADRTTAGAWESCVASRLAEHPPRRSSGDGELQPPLGADLLHLVAHVLGWKHSPVFREPRDELPGGPATREQGPQGHDAQDEAYPSHPVRPPRVAHRPGAAPQSGTLPARTHERHRGQRPPVGPLQSPPPVLRPTDARHRPRRAIHPCGPAYSRLESLNLRH